MYRGWSRRALATLVLPLSIPVTMAVAQTPTAPSSPRLENRSPEVEARLLDGRMAMIKESLKLNDQQLRLWAPVETQLRASFAARQKSRDERRARRQSGERTALALPDRLERASQRATERAEQMKGLADALRPFYAALNDEQKAVAGVVLSSALSARGSDGRRWHMRRASATERR